MRSHLETFVRQFSGLEIVFRVDNDVENTVTRLADEMLVAPDQGIEVLRPPKDQDLELVVGHKFLQIAVHRAQADVGQALAYLVVDLVRRRMRLVVLDGVPNNFKLSGIPRLYAFFGHGYAAKSSANDFCTSGESTTLAR